MAPASEAPPPGPEPRAEGPLEGFPSRLHPAAVVVWTLEAVYALVLIILTGGAVPSLGAAILAALMGIHTLRFLRFHWRLDEDSLVIEQGLLRRHRRVIPRNRVQTVDLEVRLRHRLFGVVEVRVEALGGGATEGKLAALDPQTAERLRNVLLAPDDEAGEDTEEPGEAGAPLASVGPGRLVVAGLTGGRVGVGAAIVGFGLQLVPEERLAGWLAPTNDEVPEIVAIGGLRLLAAMVVLALLAGFLLSLAATVLTYWDFTLERRGDTLRVQRGLLTLHRDTVPYRRIQAVRVEENLPRRWMGLAAVRVVVAGRAGGGEENGTDLVLPLGDRTEAFTLAGRIAGYPLEGPPALAAMPKQALRRRLVRAVAVALGGGGGVAALAGAVGNGATPPGPVGTAFLAVILLGLAGVPLALGAYHNLGNHLASRHVLVREGAITRTTTLVPLDRLQAVETSSTPFQRRRRLATLHLPIARPLRSGRAPRALDLHEEAAAGLRDTLANRIRENRDDPG